MKIAKWLLIYTLGLGAANADTKFHYGDYELGTELASCAAYIQLNKELLPVNDETLNARKYLDNLVMGWKMAAMTALLAEVSTKDTAKVVTNSIMDSTTNKVLAQLDLISMKPKESAIREFKGLILEIQTEWDDCLRLNDDVERLQKIARVHFM